MKKTFQKKKKTVAAGKYVPPKAGAAEKKEITKAKIVGAVFFIELKGKDQSEWYCMLLQMLNAVTGKPKVEAFCGIANEGVFPGAVRKCYDESCSLIDIRNLESSSKLLVEENGLYYFTCSFANDKDFEKFASEFVTNSKATGKNEKYLGVEFVRVTPKGLDAPLSGADAGIELKKINEFLVNKFGNGGSLNFANFPFLSFKRTKEANLVTYKLESPTPIAYKDAQAKLVIPVIGQQSSLYSVSVSPANKEKEIKSAPPPSQPSTAPGMKEKKTITTHGNSINSLIVNKQMNFVGKYVPPSRRSETEPSKKPDDKRPIDKRPEDRYPDRDNRDRDRERYPPSSRGDRYPPSDRSDRSDRYPPSDRSDRYPPSERRDRYPPSERRFDERDNSDRYRRPEDRERHLDSYPPTDRTDRRPEDRDRRPEDRDRRPEDRRPEDRDRRPEDRDRRPEDRDRRPEDRDRRPEDRDRRPEDRGKRDIEKKAKSKKYKV